jgi:hypothetical protein
VSTIGDDQAGRNRNSTMPQHSATPHELAQAIAISVPNLERDDRLDPGESLVATAWRLVRDQVLNTPAGSNGAEGPIYGHVAASARRFVR